MIDLHTHSLFSDGQLCPSELVYRAKTKGYEIIAITDHGDISNIDFIIPRLVKVSVMLTKEYNILVIPGIELTYVPPAQIKNLTYQSRKLGAKLVVVHGESPVEPVPPSTNLAGISSGADILAHPGYLTLEECELAKKNNVSLELTARRGHSQANAHVLKNALQTGAKIVLNTDTHSPDDLIDDEQGIKLLENLGLTKGDFLKFQQNSREIVGSR